jgi:hypothetical protein
VTISKPAYTVTPAKAGVHRTSKKRDFGFRRNDERSLSGHFAIVPKIDFSRSSPKAASG